MDCILGLVDFRHRAMTVLDGYSDGCNGFLGKVRSWLESYDDEQDTASRWKHWRFHNDEIGKRLAPTQNDGASCGLIVVRMVEELLQNGDPWEGHNESHGFKWSSAAQDFLKCKLWLRMHYLQVIHASDEHYEALY